MENYTYIQGLITDFGVENQLELAEILGVSANYISLIANGKKPISDKFVRKVKLAFSKISKDKSPITELKPTKKTTGLVTDPWVRSQIEELVTSYKKMLEILSEQLIQKSKEVERLRKELEERKQKA